MTSALETLYFEADTELGKDYNSSGEFKFTYYFEMSTKTKDALIGLGLQTWHHQKKMRTITVEAIATNQIPSEVDSAKCHASVIGFLVYVSSFHANKVVLHIHGNESLAFGKAILRKKKR